MALGIDSTDEECLTSYVNLLIKHSLKEANKYISDFIISNSENEIAPLLKVNILWKLGLKKEALSLFADCANNNKENAKELFELYPEFLKISQFNELAED